MTILLALSAHAADTPDTDALRLLVSKEVGKDVPEKYLCVETPALPAPFDPEDPVVVAGIKLKGTGCVRRAIIHGGRVLPEAGALNAVLGGGWAGLDTEAREAALTSWTRDVLHAFEQPLESPTVEVSGKKTTASLPVLRRTKVPLVAEAATATWTVDGAGVTSVAESDRQLWKTALVLETNSVKGLEEQQVSDSLDAVGKLFERCFWAAWQHDLSMNERTRLTWEVGADGKATRVTARRQFSGKLSQCFANALDRVAFPAEGSVDMEFGVSRIPLDSLPTE